MKKTLMVRLAEFASAVIDPRRTTKGNFKHKLADIITLCVLARLCQCRSRADIITFGRRNTDKFRKIGMLRNGVPSEATLCRVSSMVGSDGMASAMQDFYLHFRNDFKRKGFEINHLAIDGKCMNGTVQANGRTPDNVSIYSVNQKITVATKVCDEKTNELKPALWLIKNTDIAGSIITGDAMFCQKSIVDAIRAGKADFTLQVKSNQKTLRWGIEDALKSAVPYDTFLSDAALEHGRIERRICRAYHGEGLIADKSKWKGNLIVIEVVSEITEKKSGKKTKENRIYMSSAELNAEQHLAIIRNHWECETNHWKLDKIFHQDRIRRKSVQSAHNMDTVMRICLALMSCWREMRKKRSDKKAGDTQIMREIGASFTKLMKFLSQK